MFESTHIHLEHQVQCEQLMSTVFKRKKKSYIISQVVGGFVVQNPFVSAGNDWENVTYYPKLVIFRVYYRQPV